MKSYNMKKAIILMLCFGSLIAMLTSCEKLTIPSEENAESTDVQKVQILTRSTTDDISYPLTVYAFKSDGTCAASQTLSSASESLSLQLASGTYQIVALSNTEGYTLPDSPTLSSLIRISSEQNISTRPLQTGMANVTVGTTSQTVSVMLSYRVSTIKISLSGLPSSVTAVSMTVASQYSSLSMEGEYGDATTSTFPLTKSGDTWTAQTYTFPGASAQTVFSIALTTADGTSTYGYTYGKPLEAATPYNLSGTYSDEELNLFATFFNQGWNESIDLSFSFGPNQSGGEVTPSTVTSDFPTAGTIWDGHLVAYVYDDEGNVLESSATHGLTSVNLLLLSLEEWTKVCSAYNEENPTEAIEYTDSYCEGDLSGWSIPTKAEVLNLIQLYNVSHLASMQAINEVIVSAGGSEIVALDDDDKNVRYLCDDAEQAFTWRLTPNILKAGATTKYSLRLVNHVKAVKE